MAVWAVAHRIADGLRIVIEGRSEVDTLSNVGLLLFDGTGIRVYLLFFLREEVACLSVVQLLRDRSVVTHHPHPIPCVLSLHALGREE
mmetsp:Transcript_25561/g.24855  ORF Transcript_25561/g.24855 Transcript_25561/m.24855 type:complete len:88 (-) Transcript_25561:26-289(-)